MSRKSKRLEEKNNLETSQKNIGVSSLSVKEYLENYTVFKHGSIVWGKILKSKWWPGLVFDGALAGMHNAKDNHLWIFWFGDHLVTQLRQNKIESFRKDCFQRCFGKSSRLFKRAVLEALQVCASRSCSSTDMSKVRKGEFSVSTEMFLSEVIINTDYPDVTLPIHGETMPAWIIFDLKYLKENRSNMKAKSLHDKKCFSCQGYDSMVCQHPLFEGEICEECKDTLSEDLLAMDIDGSDVFCCICGLGDGPCVFVCSISSCKRSFCTSCLNSYCKDELFQKIKEGIDWTCFLCNLYTKDTHGSLKPKLEYKESILRFFNSTQLIKQQEVESFDSLNQGKLRVLGVYDGIGTMKAVLDNLHIDIDMYKSSEINPDAMHVSSYNHGASISFIDNARLITRLTLKTLLPLDLIFFSPPDPNSFIGPGNEHDRVVLILKCVAILKELELMEGDRPYFWLIETTPALPSKVKHAITNMLQLEPCVLSCEFIGCCPYIKPRMYWTNISGVNKIALNQTVVKKDVTRVDWTKLVHENVSAAEISKIDEIERLMGFPSGYTQTDNLSHQQRATLLKEASCPHMLKHIMQSLTKTLNE